MELTHSKPRRDKYFDINKLRSPTPKSELPKPREDGKEEPEGKMAKVLKFVMLLVDMFSDWLEEVSVLYRDVVDEVRRKSVLNEEEMNSLPTEGVASSVSGGAVGGVTTPPDTTGAKDSSSKGKKGVSAGGTVPFDERAGQLAIHLAPSAERQKEVDAYQAKLTEDASHYTRRLKRLFTALYYVFLSQNVYIPFFFILLNILVNGSILSLVYAVFLFGWGLLTVPWPSKRFWLALIFYTMFVLVVKYAFQFYDIPYWENTFAVDSGLFPPRLIGIEKQTNFVANAVVDILLLTFLLIHRGLLFVRSCVCSIMYVCACVCAHVCVCVCVV